MRNLRTEDEIIASWKGDIDTPVVSICCIAYNHEAYIEDALEGFLIQETDFPLEILIHDDASTDKTAEIIREYEADYPRLIKSIYQIENQYSKGGRASEVLRPFCRGKYIALCEGDDFWVDARKIAIQKEYLDSHPDVVISGHDSFIIDEAGSRVQDSKLPDDQKRDFSGKDLILGNGWILTMSWLYRNVPFEFIPERRMVKNGDKFFVSLLGHHGGSHYHSDIEPAGYRVHPSGVWSMLSSKGKEEEKINTWFWIYRYYNRIGQVRYAQHYWEKYIRAVVARAGRIEIARECLIKLTYYGQAKALVRRVLVVLGVMK